MQRRHTALMKKKTEARSGMRCIGHGEWFSPLGDLRTVNPRTKHLGRCFPVFVLAPDPRNLTPDGVMTRIEPGSGFQDRHREIAIT